MTPHNFIAKWRHGGDERRDAQPFFEDLCRLIGHPTPREADPDHTWFTYEYGATKTTGGQGWADVWKKGFFGWEAKGTHRSLEKAYEQLKMYADALQNPPLLVVSDLRTIVIHTNFTNTAKREIRFTVEDLADFETRQVLEAVFKNPQALRPGVTREAITKEAAQKFAELADALRGRGHEPQEVAHFLNRLVFCMFAEDIGLLPDNLFTAMVEASQHAPDLFEKRSRELFSAMHSGGDVAFKDIEWFNGGLFDDASTLRLRPEELQALLAACRLDWSAIDPSIFGTLFERGLDPNKRSQLGAHYTDPETILKIIQPVITQPWLAEWHAERDRLTSLIAKSPNKRSIPKKAKDAFNRFLERLRSFTVLDPACGSGNFLFLSLRALKDIEHRVLVEAESLGFGRQFPTVGPANVKGIELNSYAAELARITIWIGEIQWMVQNGYGAKRNPILQPLNQIENRDALVNEDGTEAEWPETDVIIGNPPFVGNRKMVGELTREYTDTIRTVYERRVSKSADFVCFWFAKADDALRGGRTRRVGLVATNSIRGGANREVLNRILEHTRIFSAWSDEPWVNEGAAVRVSLVCFGKADGPVSLDGRAPESITSSLLPLVHYDTAKAARLRENTGVAFQGVTPSASLQRKRRERLALPEASFNLEGDLARSILREPATVRGEPMCAVVRPYWIADDVTGRPLDRYIVNFGQRSEADASMFERPFAAISNVRLHREHARRNKDYPWWLLLWPRPAMFEALKSLRRYVVVPRVSKHHFCAWAPSSVTPGDALIVVARDDDTALGILQSRIHEVWALRQGTSLEDRPRYTHTTSFETFPFPKGLTPDVEAAVYCKDPNAIRIAQAACGLVEAREQWLNPPEWVERVPDVVSDFPERILPRPGCERELKKRTLTNLYNARPAWLGKLHDELDSAVAAAYGWEWPLSDEEILRRLFLLNKERSPQRRKTSRERPSRESLKLSPGEEAIHARKSIIASAPTQKPRSGIKSAPGEGATNVQTVMPPPKNPTKRK